MYEIFKNKAGAFKFRLKDNNGKELFISDEYTQKTNCEKGISSVKRNAKNEDRFEITQDISGNSFKLKAGNGQIIGSGYHAFNKDEVKNTIKAVIRIAPTASIKDLTK